MSKFRKFLIYSLITIILVGGVAGFFGYKMIFSPNINVDGKPTYFYIPTNASIETVLDSLKDNDLLKNESSFKFVAMIKKYDISVRSGRFLILSNKSNWQLINQLRSGVQATVNVIIPSVRQLDKLYEYADDSLEFTSSELRNYINTSNIIDSLGFNNETFASMFIPNTYEFYWNTSAEKFITKMKKEYDIFWTDERLGKAQRLGLTPVQVSILASIVQSEQMQHSEERPKIAGLYLNRLKKGILLQSDPTVVYAIGDFSIKRVTNAMLTINSPYNTYLHQGLPPGPILIPEISSIDAVLNAEQHNYIYMCAKDDFSGYHYFSTNLTQHMMYARKYHNALNNLNIR